MRLIAFWPPAVALMGTVGGTTALGAGLFTITACGCTFTVMPRLWIPPVVSQDCTTTEWLPSAIAKLVFTELPLTWYLRLPSTKICIFWTGELLETPATMCTGDATAEFANGVAMFTRLKKSDMGFDTAAAPGQELKPRASQIVRSRFA